MKFYFRGKVWSAFSVNVEKLHLNETREMMGKRLLSTSKAFSIFLYVYSEKLQLIKKAVIKHAVPIYTDIFIAS